MRKEPSASTLVPARDVRIAILGAFAIRSDGAFTHLPAPAQRLAAFLAMRGEPTARGIAAGTLWPEVGHDHALANLRTALWRLRGAIPDSSTWPRPSSTSTRSPRSTCTGAGRWPSGSCRANSRCATGTGPSPTSRRTCSPTSTTNGSCSKRNGSATCKSTRSSASASNSARSESTPTPSSAGSWRSKASPCGSRPIAR